MTERTRRAQRWAVVGGGMLGGVAARRLRAAGAEVVLHESAPTLGGLASAWRLPVPGGEPVTWDRFYHVILGDDRRVLALLDELGAPEVVWARSKAACYTDGRALPASSAAELVGLPFLGPVAKLRIGLTVAWAALWTAPARFDRITAARWLRRWSGRQATDRLWLPLLRAKLGECADKASAVFIWSTIRRLVTARFQGRDGDRFGHVPGGYAAVLGALADDLARAGVEVRTGSRVTAVTAAPGGRVRVEAAGACAEEFDRVLVTTAAPLASRMCPQLSDAERERLDGVEYLGVICPSVLLRRPVTGAYITYITDPLPFTAVIEMTALVDPAETGGHTLVYLPRYTRPDDPVFDRSDEDLRGEFLDPFLGMYGLAPDDVVSFAVARARHVMPVPTPGYPQRVPAVRTTVAGVFTLGSAQITVGTLNVEQTLQLLDEGWPQLDLAPEGCVDPAAEPADQGVA
ncbi:MAG: FAD-dependent oxidoreductase [Pseudonocardia sp.]